MWWFYAHFLARKHRSSIKALLIRAKKNGSQRMITKGTSKRGTFTIELGKGKRIYLDTFPPKSEEIRQVSNKETWTVDLKPVNSERWLQGRSAATRLSALVRNDGLCERCQERPAVQVHHKNRMKTKRSILAKVASDRDQRNQARALCKECHLRIIMEHGRDNTNMVGWSAGCGESVRRVTHGRNCHQRWPKFRADDFEVNASPRPERARGQEHGRKAGDNRRRVRCCPATPERYGESWITRTPM